MKTIAFYSYKGGVGRTLALSNIATRLADFGKKVVMLDLDLEAPGLHCKFPEYKESCKTKNGIVDYIYEYAVNHKIPSKIKPYTCNLNIGYSSLLHLIPAGDPKSSEYWKKLSSINWYELLYGKNATGVAFFMDLKDKIEKELKPDYLLIDTRTGITDISSLTISLLADRLVILSANNEENIEGCQRIVRSVLSEENSLHEKEIILALTRIPSSNTPEERLREEGLVNNFKKHFEGFTYPSGKAIDNTPVVIHSDRNLECRESFKIGFERETRNSSEIITKEYLELFGRITANDLSTEEIKRFEDRKEISRLSDKIVLAKSSLEAILLAEEAIKNFPEESVFYYLRAENLFYLAKNDEALIAINKAIDLEERSNYTHLKACILFQQEKFDEAYNVILSIKDISPTYLLNYCLIQIIRGKLSEEILKDLKKVKEMGYSPAIADNMTAIYYNKMEEYEKAESFSYQALEQDKNDPDLYATLAEIKANQNEISQFYMNIDIALSKGLNMYISMIQSPQIYAKFKNDEKFLSLLKRYDKDKEIELLKTL